MIHRQTWNWPRGRTISSNLSSPIFFINWLMMRLPPFSKSAWGRPILNAGQSSPHFLFFQNFFNQRRLIEKYWNNRDFKKKKYYEFIIEWKTINVSTFWGEIFKGRVLERGSRYRGAHFTRKTQSLLSKYTRNIKAKFNFRIRYYITCILKHFPRDFVTFFEVDSDIFEHDGNEGSFRADRKPIFCRFF